MHVEIMTFTNMMEVPIIDLQLPLSCYRIDTGTQLLEFKEDTSQIFDERWYSAVRTRSTGTDTHSIRLTFMRI
jgi:hypothetical protein